MVNILEILHTEDSRVNFIKGLINLSKASEMAEGRIGIEDEELEFLRNAMSALQLGDQKKQELEAMIYSKENKVDIYFEYRKQALFFLREGIQVCYIEGQYQKAERDMVHSMSQQLGISKKCVEEIERWALEGREWANRGEKILELEC